MTADDQDAAPQHDPRHRLVGALVLLALAVIFIPLVLDFRRDFDGDIRKSNIPPRPEDFKVEVMPLPAPGEAGAPVVPEPPPPLEHKPQAPPPAATGTPPPARAPVSPAGPARPRPAPSAAGKKGEDGQAAAGKKWVVQVGSFSSQRNARALRDRLRKQGLPALVETVQVAGKPAYRVLVGPEPGRAQAEARRNLLRRLGLKGIVMVHEGRGP
ncbi:MAG TPA: SPOR domain-containing protein [Gammaproteobacteria bacterium]|nr:SPOR domain-containing protein [Gammaproteobacteria bacterium]